MGVYISTMQKPESCIECDLAWEEDYEYLCPFSRCRESAETCPLVDVPERHRDQKNNDRIPSVEEVVYCKDCIKHNRAIGDYEMTETGPRWFKKEETCPLITYRGKAQGHEFDYQYCVCGIAKE